MIEKPLITVGSLCYNNSENVIQTLTTLKNQTYKNIEHIILDDCSQDGSGARVKNWIEENNYKCRFIQNEKNLGICKSLNKILKLAKGEYWTANSDDYWEPFHLEKSLELLRGSGADVIYSTTRICRPNGEFLYNVEDTLPMFGYTRYNELFPSSQGSFLLSKEDAVDALFYCNYLHLLSFLIPMRLLSDLGGYNENLPFEDYDLNFNICRKAKVLFNKDFSATYYKHEKSYTEAPSRKASLHWGIVLTLINHMDLINKEDTKTRVERTIRNSCAEILKYKPSKLLEVIKVLRKAFPANTIFQDVFFVIRQLVGNRRTYAFALKNRIFPR